MEKTPTSKKVITFIFLKVIEIGSLFGIVFGPYFLGKFFNKYELTSLVETNWMNGIVNIILGLGFIVFSCLLLFLAYLLLSEFIKLNWKWACILNETPMERKIRETREKKIIKEEEKRKEQEFRDEHGFYIGDKVRVTVAYDEDDEKILNKVMKVKSIDWSRIYLHGHNEWMKADQLKLVKTKRDAKRGN